MKTRNKTKRVITISVLIAVSVVFSYFDNLISNGIFAPIRMIMPNFKMGLANLVIIIFVCRYSFLEGLIAVVLKSTIVSLMFSGPTGFMIGFPGSLLSFIVMKLLFKLLKDDKYIFFVSAMGGISHSLGQIISAFCIYGLTNIESFLIYSPLVLIISLITGFLVGIVGKKVIKLLDSSHLLNVETKEEDN